MTFSLHANNLTPQIKKQHDAKNNVKINTQYPLFVGKKLSAREQHFNATINHLIETEINQFKTLVDEDTNKEKNTSDITITYKILMTASGTHPLLSILFTIDSYVAGGAYPNVHHRTVNFNFDQNKEMALNELFKPNSNFISILNAYCGKILTKITGETEQQMIQAQELSYTQWNVTPQGLLIQFDEFAHAIGPQTVLVPYEAIKQALNIESPINICLENAKNCVQ